MVELDGYEARLPRQLSGGQQQRVALARAIVFNPRLLLLDEPFGALDRKLRETMQLEVRRLQRRLGLTTIFITHDQEEALVLSDRIAVMNGARSSRSPRPTEIYERPANDFVADFVGESNIFHGTMSGGHGHARRRAPLPGRAAAPRPRAPEGRRADAPRALGDAPTGVENRLRRRGDRGGLSRDFVQAAARLRRRPRAAGAPARAWRAARRTGTRASVGIEPESIHVF
jgi:ABC-type Fe3+/spermidine/putrescine transport system ATPase subunit